MLTLYDYSDSGNGYKIRLLLALLGRDYESVEVDILAGESRTDAFLARNPNGRVPVLAIDGDHLAESNAILYYLAADTPYLPDDPLARAKTLEWMFFEQYSHEPFIATSRFLLRHTGDDDPRRAGLPERHARGCDALAVMESHLSQRETFVGSTLTIADIALFAYTHVADEGGFDLAPYPSIGRWLDTVRRTPGFVAMVRA